MTGLVVASLRRVHRTFFGSIRVPAVAHGIRPILERTWTDLASYFNSNFGIPISGNRGWGFAYFTFTIPCAADRVNANTFLIYNATPPGAFYLSRKRWRDVDQRGGRDCRASANHCNA